MSATAASNIETPAYTSGLAALTPNNSEVIDRVRSSAPATPRPMPIPVMVPA